ncbi:hypothetical protein GGTG_03948 [Gaeumannomyces tritici R3-111a-1]|uniref:Cytochrome P450 n=1 Tax=Gaeumannomyces tritici (strain R3-111a-1) TaxID=644352 RepID=J3NRP8_GAET3|nr:hypothetical protein GGTG_03948 [Gaeumannomyces tritici R3-111a-1]EJT78854.1 hypothetical protein GGTG_03948 [Gaeumannomyces tritici R3-111a-1]
MLPLLSVAQVLLKIGGVLALATVISNPLSHISGPWYTRWTTLPSVYFILTARHPVWIHSLHERYGPVVRYAPGEVDVSDPAAAQSIHAAKAGFLKSPLYSRLITDLSSVFNEIGPEVHRRYKRYLSGHMSETGLKAFLPRIDDKVRLAIRKMAEESRGTRGAADVAKWLMFLSFDVIGDLIFGSSFGQLERGEKNRPVDDFVNLGPAGGLRSMFPTLAKVSAVVPIPAFRAATLIQWRTFDYAQRALDSHQKQVEEAGGVDPRPTVFSRLYSATAEESWTPVEVRDNAQVFIVGGSDTTANSMIYLLWSVCRGPRIKARLLAELDTLTPDEGGDGQDFSYEQLRDLPYVNWVVNETLRLYTALSRGLPRLVPQGGTTLVDKFLPAGATVTTQAYSLHQDETAFPDPYKFYPERWENTTQRMKDCTMPFGGGARTCLSRHLARIELRLITARFFKAFPDAVVSDLEGMSDKDMEPALHFLMVPSGHRCLIRTEGPGEKKACK